MSDTPSTAPAEAGYLPDSCPECGAPLEELVGGDGRADEPAVALGCLECDYEISLVNNTTPSTVTAKTPRSDHPTPSPSGAWEALRRYEQPLRAAIKMLERRGGAASEVAEELLPLLGTLTESEP